MGRWTRVRLLWIPWNISSFGGEKTGTEALPTSAQGSCDLAQPAAENRPGKVGVGGVLGAVKASRPEELAVTGRSTAGVIPRLPPLPAMHVKLK